MCSSYHIESTSFFIAKPPCFSLLLPKFSVRHVRRFVACLSHVKVEGGWKLSASFPVDSVGEYTLRLTRQVDVNKLKHISTRRSSEYDVVIPQMEVCARMFNPGFEGIRERWR